MQLISETRRTVTQQALSQLLNTAFNEISKRSDLLSNKTDFQTSQQSTQTTKYTPSKAKTMQLTPSLLIPLLSAIYLLSVYLILKLLRLKSTQNLLSNFLNNQLIPISRQVSESLSMSNFCEVRGQKPFLNSLAEEIS